MPATNHTKNFNLPIYLNSDHFNIVGDLNGAMNAIDEHLGEAIVTSKAASRDATSALTASNEAADNTAEAKESAKSALAVVATASGKADKALKASAEAKTTADSAISQATAASNSAASALSNANNAMSVANQSRQNSEAALSAASQANTTTANLSSGIAEAKTAGDLANTTRTRFIDKRAGSEDKNFTSTSDVNPGFTYEVMSKAIDLNANDVINVNCHINHTTVSGNAQFYLYFTKPSGAKDWIGTSGIAGYYDGAKVNSEISGIFQANEGAGRYTVALLIGTPKNKSVLVNYAATSMVIH